MSVYTTEERVKMVTWFLGGNSLRRTAELFSVFFNGRPIPSKNTIARIVKQFQTTGCVSTSCIRNRNEDAGGLRANEQDIAIDICAAIEADPNLSIRQLSAERGISRSYVHRILKRHNYFPYKYANQQELIVGDEDRRASFCEIMMEKCNADNNFLRSVCFTDESTFTLNGEPNHQNCRFWSQQNQHVALPTHTQYRRSVNVWAGILGNNIIGPFFIDGRLNSEAYIDLLSNEVFPTIAQVAEDIPTVWYQHDGAPAHSSAAVREYLNDAFPNSWIGRNGTVAWPPRSPDLSPLDFFFWGYLKSKIYTVRRHPNLESLKDRIQEVCFNITPDVLENVRRSFYDRLGYCLAVNGQTFEHLI